MVARKQKKNKKPRKLSRTGLPMKLNTYQTHASEIKWVFQEFDLKRVVAMGKKDRKELERSYYNNRFTDGSEKIKKRRCQVFDDSHPI